MTEMLPDGPDQGVQLRVAGNAGVFLDTRAPHLQRAVAIKFVEEAGQAEAQWLAVTDASQDLCQRSRSGREGLLS